uniref:Uncharacterized protein n=1 Tax=Lepeophtheirus salmonis TaxID=72036 RepID=A0A0K2VI42_LEPSM
MAELNKIKKEKAVEEAKKVCISFYFFLYKKLNSFDIFFII